MGDYALRYDSTGNNYTKLTSGIFLNYGSVHEVEALIKISSLTGKFPLLNREGDFKGIWLEPINGRVVVDEKIITCPDLLSDVYLNIRLMRDAGEDWYVYIDNVLQGSYTSGGITQYTYETQGRASSQYHSAELQFLKYTKDSVPALFLDPDSSDRSGSTAQPILTDTIGGNNAVGFNFPAFDPSVWVNLGGGATESTIDFTASKPEFAIVSNATLPAVASTVDFNISKPEFYISSGATLPAPQNSISLEISKPIFSIDSSATLPTPQSQINIDIGSPEFNIQSSATIPYPQSSVVIDVAAPLFSIQSSVIGTAKSALSISIAKPQFSIESAATLPNPASAVELTISRPVFKVYSYIGGLDIIAAEDARLTFNAGSNNLEFSNDSNSLTFNAQTNILTFKE